MDFDDRFDAKNPQEIVLNVFVSDYFVPVMSRCQAAFAYKVPLVVSTLKVVKAQENFDFPKKHVSCG